MIQKSGLKQEQVQLLNKELNFDFSSNQNSQFSPSKIKIQKLINLLKQNKNGLFQKEIIRFNHFYNDKSKLNINHEGLRGGSNIFQAKRKIVQKQFKINQAQIQSIKYDESDDDGKKMSTQLEEDLNSQQISFSEGKQSTFLSKNSTQLSELNENFGKDKLNQQIFNNLIDIPEDIRNDILKLSLKNLKITKKYEVNNQNDDNSSVNHSENSEDSIASFNDIVDVIAHDRLEDLTKTNTKLEQTNSQKDMDSYHTLNLGVSTNQEEQKFNEDYSQQYQQQQQLFIHQQTISDRIPSFNQVGVNRINKFFYQQSEKPSEKISEQESLRIYEEQSKVKSPKFLDEDDEIFLRNQFEHRYLKLGKYFFSGGEADIFIDESQNLVNRVCKTSNKHEYMSFKQEFESIQSFLHKKNIIYYKDALFLKMNENVTFIIFIMELCQFSLHQEIAEKKKFNLFEVLKIMFDLFDGLIELRLHYIYHSDIKPSNILKKFDGTYVISDFGISQKVSEDNPLQFKQKGYTPGYKPQKIIDPFYHDIYSVAVTIKNTLKLCDNPLICLFKEQIDELLREDEQIKFNCHDFPRQFLLKIITQNDSDVKLFLDYYLSQINIILKRDMIKQGQNKKQSILKMLYEYSLLKYKIQNKLESNQIELYQSLQYIAKNSLRRKDYRVSIKYFYEIIKKISNSKIIHLDISIILVKSLRKVANIFLKKGNYEDSLKIQEILLDFIQQNKSLISYLPKQYGIVSVCQLFNKDLKQFQFYYDQFKQQQKFQQQQSLRKTNGYQIKFSILKKIVKCLIKTKQIKQQNKQFIVLLLSFQHFISEIKQLKLLRLVGIFYYKYLHYTFLEAQNEEEMIERNFIQYLVDNRNFIVLLEQYLQDYINKYKQLFRIKSLEVKLLKVYYYLGVIKIYSQKIIYSLPYLKQYLIYQKKLNSILIENQIKLKYYDIFKKQNKRHEKLMKLIASYYCKNKQSIKQIKIKNEQNKCKQPLEMIDLLLNTLDIIENKPEIMEDHMQNQVEINYLEDNNVIFHRIIIEPIQEIKTINQIQNQTEVQINTQLLHHYQFLQDLFNILIQENQIQILNTFKLYKKCEVIILSQQLMILRINYQETQNEFVKEQNGLNILRQRLGQQCDQFFPHIFHIDNQNKYIYMEFLNNNLLQMCIQMKDNSEKEDKSFFKQICQAVQQLHSHGIIHGDIKLENIYINLEKNGEDSKSIYSTIENEKLEILRNFQRQRESNLVHSRTQINEDDSQTGQITNFCIIKLCNFEHSSSQGNENLRGIRGTERYIESNLLKQLQLNINQEYNGYKFDIFALGITLFELLIQEKFSQSLLKFVANVTLFWYRLNKIYSKTTNWSNDLKYLFIKMVNPQENERWSIDEIMNSQWLAE